MLVLRELSSRINQKEGEAHDYRIQKNFDSVACKINGMTIFPEKENTFNILMIHRFCE
jgi:hypothetical protein